MKILVVENDPVTVVLLQQLLSGIGHEVVTTAFAADAVQLLMERSWDCLILDMILSGGNGYDVLCHGILPPKVIVTTALDHTDPERLCGCRLLMKPFTFEQLQQALEA